MMNKISDADVQKKILEEDRRMQRLNRKFYYQTTCLILFIAFFLILSYVIIYVYKDNGLTLSSNCQDINKEDPNHIYQMINISEETSCKVKYNIDYHKNGRVLFNIDMFGNKTRLFNEINKKDKNGNCLLNCDMDDDGFPDYNIDLNGDGTVDLNKGGKDNCQDLCDKDFNMIIDTIKQKIDKKELMYLNYDINYDGVCDINCDTDNDYIADKNIDTDNDLIPDKIIDYDNDGVCDNYCEEALNIKDESPKEIVIDDKNTESNIEINLAEIEPREEAIFTIVLKNTKKNAVKYDISWNNITNTYLEYRNLNYIIDKNNQLYIEQQELPFEETNLKSDVLAPGSSVKFTIKIPTSYYSSLYEFKANFNIKTH